MRLLAIDTALGACAAIVYDSEAGALLAVESLAMARGHAEALMPLIARLMDQAGIEFLELDRIAVTVGPGSFTGLRVGIAAARGIALAAGRPAVGVSTLAAYAAPHIAIDRAETVAVAIDARNDQVYFQLFGPGGRSLVPPRHVAIGEAAGLDAVRSLDGPVHIAGSAAQRLAAAWPPGATAPIVAEPKPAPDIEWVAKLGAAAQAGLAPPKPAYLRPPGAQPQNTAGLPRQ
jgi:tRNA threonylcarbamoyladenosine biosynthesis protein TsaB